MPFEMNDKIKAGQIVGTTRKRLSRRSRGSASRTGVTTAAFLFGALALPHPAQASDSRALWEEREIGTFRLAEAPGDETSPPASALVSSAAIEDADDHDASPQSEPDCVLPQTDGDALMRTAAFGPDEPAPAAAQNGLAYGPPLPPLPATPIVGAPKDKSYRSFGSQVGAVKWEMAGILTYYTAINGTKLFEDPTWPHFHKEGWFGTTTNNAGVDKLAHAYSSYVLAELIHARLRRKTDGAPGIKYTAAALAYGTMLYTEFWDSIERSSGWSWEDVTFNTLGAGFSLLRNSVPGLDRKLDYRLMIVPNSNLFNAEGKRHFEQQRYYFALKLSGFKAFEQGPLRFVELHAGYYAKDFTNADKAMGIVPKRRLFVGVGINLRELFFRDPKGRVGRAVGDALDYFQPPYTAARVHLTN